jgi:hypothetical protein
MSNNQDISVWKVISTVAKGVAKTVEIAGSGVSTAVTGVQRGATAVRDSMPVTEITTVFNTTDKIVKFINRETPRDSKDILGQSAVSLKTEHVAGAWVPWFDPPLYDGFERRHIAIVIDDVPVLYIWQKGDYIYWTNRLDSTGKPAKSYRMSGVAHVGGARTLVVRNDPDTEYSAFMTVAPQ